MKYKDRNFSTLRETKEREQLNVMHGPGLYPWREGGYYKAYNGQLAKVNVDYRLGNSVIAMLNIVNS